MNLLTRRYAPGLLVPDPAAGFVDHGGATIPLGKPSTYVYADDQERSQKQRFMGHNEYIVCAGGVGNRLLDARRGICPSSSRAPSLDARRGASHSQVRSVPPQDQIRAAVPRGLELWLRT